MRRASASRSAAAIGGGAPGAGPADGLRGLNRTSGVAGDRDIYCILTAAGELVSRSSYEGTAVGIRDANLAARFRLELGTLATLEYWGLQTGESGLTKIALGVEAPLTGTVVWGTFGSPQAPVSLAPAARLVLQRAVFGASAAALADAGRPARAGGFAAAVAANTLPMIAWGQ